METEECCGVHFIIGVPGSPLGKLRDKLANELGLATSEDVLKLGDSKVPFGQKVASVGKILRSFAALFLPEEGEGPGNARETVADPTINQSSPNIEAPTEAYNRSSHYGKTPKASDRQTLGANKGEVVDHDPPLVKRYYEGDSNVGEKPGYKMTKAERKASANDRSRMKTQPNKESQQQGAEMSRYSRQQKKKNGL